MASQKERWLSHLRLYLHIKNRPKSALPLSEALEVLDSQNLVGSTEAMLVDERWIIQLAGMDRRTDRRLVTLLFLGIDKDRAEAVYGDIKTLNLRTASKTDTEGGAVSAHLVIDLESTIGMQGHRAILEDVEGLSRSSLIPYLRWLLGKFVNFTDEDASGEEINVSPNISSDVVLDKPITEQLNSARLIAVDVFKKARSSTIDKSLDYFEKTRLIEYRPVSPVRGPAAIKIIQRILADAPKTEYPEVRVRVQDSVGTERSVGVDRERQDALMSAFQLRTFIAGLTPPLSEASKNIVPHLVKEMKAALIDASRKID